MGSLFNSLIPPLLKRVVPIVVLTEAERKTMEEAFSRYAIAVGIRHQMGNPSNPFSLITGLSRKAQKERAAILADLDNIQNEALAEIKKLITKGKQC